MSNDEHTEVENKLLKKLHLKMTPKEIRQHVIDLCMKHDYDPIESLMSIALEGYKVMVDGNEITVPIEPKDAITIHKEIAGYIAPKVKTIDIQGEVKQDIKITVQKFGEQIIEGVIIDEVKTLSDGSSGDEG